MPGGKRRSNRKLSKSNRSSKSALDILRAPLRHLSGHIKAKGQNSKYNGRPIALEEIRAWEDFVTVEEIEDLWDRNPEMARAIKRPLTAEELESCTIGTPIAGYNLSEMSFERLWGPVHHRHNLVSHVCAKEIQKTDKPVHIIMGDGVAAQWVAPEAEEGAEKKQPDHAGYQYCSNYTSVDHKQVFNRIPGEAKLYRKICREMLPPDGAKYKPKLKNAEARKVLNQIHGYMDQRSARFGYLATDKELIFIRRRDTGWGHIDISPAIPHDVKADRETGTLNSSYVLFYFHWKIANDDSDSGWHLRSFASDGAKANSADDRELINSLSRLAALKRKRMLSKEKIKRWNISNGLVTRAMSWIFSFASRKVDVTDQERGLKLLGEQ